jgi:hypothetical protein
LGLGDRAADAIKDEVKFMEGLTKHLELKAPEKSGEAEADEVVRGDVGKDLRRADAEAALRRAALAWLLEETAPNNYRARRWGSLRRVRISDNSYRWLCGDCAKRRR